MIDEEKLLNNPEEYALELEAGYADHENDAEYVQELAEVLLEVGNAEKAFPLINQALNLDPEGEKGPQKFFWAGQLVGGKQGIEFFTRGCQILHKKAENADPKERNVYLSQISNGLLAMIEIWMTDLCMEPEAEKQCEGLISEASICTPNSPEVQSVLGSIRISQLRNDDAKQALTLSWNLYKKMINEKLIEYAQLPQLIRLAQSMLELRLLEQVVEITEALVLLDDEIPDTYYLSALAHQLLGDTCKDEEKIAHHEQAIEACELAEKLQDVDEEILEACQQIRAQLVG